MTKNKTKEHGKRGRIPDSWWPQERGNGLRVVARAKSEYLGYPTQKPVALLERIINASSNKGDLIFDPFAGCATTVIAANRLNRRWICCDISESVFPILKMRLRDEFAKENPKLTWRQGTRRITEVKNPQDMPTKNFHKQVRNSRTLKKLLVIQELDTDKLSYKCNGCGYPLPIRLLEIDHLVPKSKGGDNSIGNRILLCSNCNRKKGNKTWEEWKKKPFTKFEPS